MKAERGFSTLEVIAAVAIIAIALVPILSLQTQVARSQGRLADIHAETTAVNNAMALLREVNPLLTPQGQRQIDDTTTLNWTSAPASALQQSTNPAGFEIQLYRVTAVIHRARAESTSLEVDLIGWRATSDGRGSTP